MCWNGKCWLCAGVLLLAGLGGYARNAAVRARESDTADDHECVLPNETWKMAFKDEVPITFVARGQNPTTWDALKAFWNDATEKVIDPRTSETVERKVVKIKLPLGLNGVPQVPAENPMTVQKWKLGKELYFDNILSSDRSVSCATCHDPAKGYTDQSPVSTGIRGNKGGVSAPTVLNSAYNANQFWDGRAASLE